ncbi:unnamed protein product [Vicia faba]|uniref:Uncharacterized protein n=1 Tax=Vicia faba TaxID=3906 RepID=A0AAV1AF60_VICFA|nr:unnamed protein product [Vicia faba]
MNKNPTYFGPLNTNLALNFTISSSINTTKDPKVTNLKSTTLPIHAESSSAPSLCCFSLKFATRLPEDGDWWKNVETKLLLLRFKENSEKTWLPHLESSSVQAWNDFDNCMKGRLSLTVSLDLNWFFVVNWCFVEYRSLAMKKEMERTLKSIGRLV